MTAVHDHSTLYVLFYSYSKSTWQLTCGSGSLCTDPSYVEPFPITASVRFIKVPANTPEPKIRYVKTIMA